MLAGVGLATTVLNVMCSQILMGINGAQETLTSQAFGNGNLDLCGIYLNQGRLINTAVFVPIVVLMIFSNKILLVMGQNEEVVEHAYKYILVCLPGVFC